MEYVKLFNWKIKKELMPKYMETAAVTNNICNKHKYMQIWGYYF